MTSVATSAIRNAPVRSFVHVADIPGSPSAARQAASRAARKGDILPIRRGLYYRGVPTRYGMTGPRPAEIVEAVFGARGVGPSGYSAAQAWGVSTQVPPRYTVAVPHVVDPIPGVDQVSRRNTKRVGLDPLEIALLEIMRSPETLVQDGWGALVKRVRNAIVHGQIRPEALTEAATGESSVAARTRFVKLLADAMVLLEKPDVAVRAK